MELIKREEILYVRVSYPVKDFITMTAKKFKVSESFLTEMLLKEAIARHKHESKTKKKIPNKRRDS